MKTKDRDGIRSAKNVNYKLHKLKQQIKAEKLKKKLEKVGKSLEEIDMLDMNDSNKRKRGGDDGDGDDDGDDDGNVLIVKKRHNWKDKEEEQDDDGDNLPLFDVNKVTRTKSDKRICIDATTNNQNKRIIFNEDSDEEDEEIDVSKNTNFRGEITESHEFADVNAGEVEVNNYI